MEFRTLTNVRPAQDTGTKLVANPTKGSFKISLGGAKILGAANGSLLHIVAHPQQEGVFFVGLGHVKNEGQDNAKNVGAILARGGSYLSCSAAAAWVEMGDEDNSTTYEIDAENFEEDAEGRKYFLLGTPVKKAKIARTQGEAAPAAETAHQEEQEAPMEETATPGLEEL